jgi:hypothetical protein
MAERRRRSERIRHLHGVNTNNAALVRVQPLNRVSWALRPEHDVVVGAVPSPNEQSSTITKRATNPA